MRVAASARVDARGELGDARRAAAQQIAEQRADLLDRQRFELEP